MDTAVAQPLMESNILEDMTRGPQQSTKSSFTVKDILQLPSTQQSYMGEIGDNVRQNISNLLHLEERNRFGSTSSIHSDYGHEYGQFSSSFYPHSLMDPNRHFQTEQRSVYGYDEMQNRYQPEAPRENYLNSIDQDRYQNIGSSDHPPPSGKRVHSVESMAETSGSPSPSTLSPSPNGNGVNRGSYFACEYDRNMEKTCDKASDFDYTPSSNCDTNFNLPTSQKNSDNFDKTVKDVSPSYSHPTSIHSENEQPAPFEGVQAAHHPGGKLTVENLNFIDLLFIKILIRSF